MTKFDFVFLSHFWYLSINYIVCMSVMFQTLLRKDFRTSYGLMLFKFAVETRHGNVVNNVDVSRHQFVICLLPAPEQMLDRISREL